MPVSEYDVSVRKAGFGRFDVTANSENAQKLLGKGTFTYEEAPLTHSRGESLRL